MLEVLGVKGLGGIGSKMFEGRLRVQGLSEAGYGAQGFGMQDYRICKRIMPGACGMRGQK